MPSFEGTTAMGPGTRKSPTLRSADPFTGTATSGSPARTSGRPAAAPASAPLSLSSSTNAGNVCAVENAACWFTTLVDSAFGRQERRRVVALHLGQLARVRPADRRDGEPDQHQHGREDPPQPPEVPASSSAWSFTPGPDAARAGAGLRRGRSRSGARGGVVRQALAGHDGSSFQTAAAVAHLNPCTKVTERRLLRHERRGVDTAGLRFERVGFGDARVEYETGLGSAARTARAGGRRRGARTPSCSSSTRRSTRPVGAPHPADRPFDGTPVIDVDRGGRITWHGPGQIVGYPIVSCLPRRRRRLRPAPRGGADRRLRRPRRRPPAGSRDAAASGSRRPPSTRRGGRRERKVAAIGVRVAQGVTMHGFALNCDPDLSLVLPDRPVRHPRRRRDVADRRAGAGRDGRRGAAARRAAPRRGRPGRVAHSGRRSWGSTRAAMSSIMSRSARSMTCR